jgi:hypothetical protein
MRARQKAIEERVQGPALRHEEMVLEGTIIINTSGEDR